MRHRARPRRGRASPWAVGNRISLTDAEGHTTGFRYDGVGRLTQITYPMGAPESYAYEDGRLEGRDDGRGNVKYAYDPAGRLVGVTPYGGRGPSTTCGYDHNGNSSRPRPATPP